MSFIKQIVFFGVLVFVISTKSKAQGIFVSIHLEKSIDSIYLKTSTEWVLLTPYAFVSKRFSPDYGNNWKRAGMFGQNLKPYIENNPVALKNLQTYSTIRLAGIAQMFVIAPFFLYKEIEWTNNHNNTLPSSINESYPGYILGFFAFLYSGAATYHLISKQYFRNALFFHYQKKKTVSNDKILNPNFGLTYNYKSNCPMLSLSLDF